VKRFLKRNSHNSLFKSLAGFGRSLNRFYENRNHDIHSNGELTVLQKLSRFRPGVIIDGGANTGEYSLLAGGLCPESRIYSFEPVKSTFEKLRENVRGCSNIFPERKGLFKENCTRTINIFDSDAHSSLYDIRGISYSPNGQETIELVRGDDFMRDCKLDKVDLLKIDVEGAEYDALVGFGENIGKGKIRMIQFEYGYINISTKKLLVDFYSFLESRGYLIGKIFPGTVEFRKYEFKHEDFIGPNYLAVRESETELITALMKK
jgi:FkbM family methyltransferase